MRLLFVKGDKGLVANRDGLFYFPDRNSSIASEGLYNCTVTIDKGNYAFVTETRLIPRNHLSSMFPPCFAGNFLKPRCFHMRELILSK